MMLLSGFVCEKECDEVAERIFEMAQRPIKIDADPPAQHVLGIEAARGEPHVLVHPTRFRLVAVCRFVSNPDPHFAPVPVAPFK